MKKLSLWLALVCITSQAGTTWNEKMKGLNQNLGELLSLVSNEQKYQDPKNQTKITNSLKELSSLSHELKSTEGFNLNQDPAIAIFSKHLSEDVESARKAFIGGHKTYARGLIQSLTHSCIACHSRTAGIQTSGIELKNADEYKTIDIANFFAATRQFDRAIEEYKATMKTADGVMLNPWDWEEALKQSMIIAVRVKKDPKLAASIVEQALDAKQIPYFVKQYVMQWKKSIENWKKEAKVPYKEKPLYVEAQRLITNAKRLQKYPMDHSGDIEYLRASAVLYDLIAVAPKGEHVSEALFMQGISHESIAPRKFENLPRVFYEECIMKAPHSPVAQFCYGKYEELTYNAFTGSAGTEIPPEVKEKLLKLWTEAMSLKSSGKIQ